MQLAVCPRVQILCIGDTIMVKFSLIHEQNIIHKLWVSFQLPTKLYATGVISWQKMLHLLVVVGEQTITVQSPLYLLWNGNLCRNSAYSCIWNSMNSIEHVTHFVMPLLLIFCISLWEGTSFFLNSLHVVKNVSMWNSTMWKALLVSHYNSPTISTTKSVYEICISIFLMHKYERHFTNIFVQRKASV
jgi:hypothetical protein